MNQIDKSVDIVTEALIREGYLIEGKDGLIGVTELGAKHAIEVMHYQFKEETIALGLKLTKNEHDAMWREYLDSRMRNSNSVLILVHHYGKGYIKEKAGV